MNLSVHIPYKEVDLIQACIRREEWAQQRIYEDYHASMLGVCMRYASRDEEAFDILHEGFLKVFQHIHTYEAGTALSAWIRRVMVNTAIDYYRKEKRRITQSLDTVFTLSSNEVTPISEMSAEEILVAIQKLTPIYRSVFNLYVIEGFSHREISGQLGITESTSRSNLVKARLKLKELLHGEEE